MAPDSSVATDSASRRSTTSSAIDPREGVDAAEPGPVGCACSVMSYGYLPNDGRAC
jgi:hypothetical protein